VTVALDETAVKVDDAMIPLTPGMTVTVEIKADSRGVIDYILSPLARIASEALKEK
jgi:hemolysin D